MSEQPSLPAEAEKLFASSPAEFVHARNALARKLRGEGRTAEAAAVADLRKPAAVVFAVNRAARDRPNAAKAAASAAARVRYSQARGDADAFDKALADLDSSLDLLAEVAVAHLAPGEKPPSEAMRRRLRELLRSAVADDDARDALVRGVLAAELEPVGFAAYAGVPVKPRPRGRRAEPERPTREDRAEARRRERRQKLEADLSDAEKELREATAAVRAAERTRERAEKAVERLRARLEEPR